ncbi:uncharacterized protein DCS_03122 [Drechmeria coniospora]|uniref:RAS small monomeric GTPase Rab6 n=1 Tax=Drechmeria coniospora TaxID=98403 RepID=A0A151GY08_DRECN|nr:uncharacterized protein DCS_03122 [Drechmeria coniospora]KYK61977.1 uncharacterized protein DCS_03122 [Drechmeria coniospora]
MHHGNRDHGVRRQTAATAAIEDFDSRLILSIVITRLLSRQSRRPSKVGGLAHETNTSLRSDGHVEIHKIVLAHSAPQEPLGPRQSPDGHGADLAGARLQQGHGGLSTYLYSIAVLGLLIYLIPHVRRQNPFECLTLAWLYLLDTAINGAYTAAFGVEWYFASTANQRAGSPSSPPPLLVVEGLRGPGQGDDGYGKSMPPETATSMLLIAGLTLVRVYFSIVVMAFARQVLQRYMQMMILEGPGVDEHEGPFAIDLPDGDGRRGRFGRLMLSFGRGYWLDVAELDDWERNAHRKAQAEEHPERQV